LLNTPKTTKKFLGSWKVYKRLYPTIKSVCELGIVLDADRGSRWYSRWISRNNRWKSRNKGAK